jgi:hypothetical protein
MNEETIIKLAVIISLTLITLTGIILNRIDIALVTLLTSAIAGIGGYIIGESKSTRIREQIRERLDEIDKLLGTTDDEADENETSE